MDLDSIKQHWLNWATEYGENLRATTKAPTIKQLEIAALARQINAHSQDSAPASMLEVGCGNGYNCHALAKDFPNSKITGVDYIPDMVAAANELKSKLDSGTQDRLAFYEGDILHLNKLHVLNERYDVVFTNRCLINLNTPEKQLEGIDQLCQKLEQNGLLLLLENQVHTHSNQNHLRESLGLTPRAPAEFNLFMDQKAVLAHLASKGFEHIAEDNFASLHDICLYVLIPAINNGEVDYQHPLMQAVTQLCLNNPNMAAGELGNYGQNQLLVFRRS